jgi:hypothetical protein
MELTIFRTSAFHNFRDWYCQLLKTNVGATVHHYPPSSFVPSACAVPSTSVILKCIVGVVFCKCSAPPATLPRSPQLSEWQNLRYGKQRIVAGDQEKRVGRVAGETTVKLFLVKKPLVKKARSFVAKVCSKAFAHVHAVAIKRHSNMQNRLFSLSEHNE